MELENQRLLQLLFWVVVVSRLCCPEAKTWVYIFAIPVNFALNFFLFKIKEYVKNGKTKAHIEIELVSSANQVATFHRSFDVFKKETFSVDGAKLTKKEYLRRIKEFNIQVDNLCMFLPQDRVQDFTKMNAQELLHNTQISVCDVEVNEAFNKLVELRTVQKNNSNINHDILTRLTDHKNRNDQLRSLIENDRLKNKLIAQLEVFSKKKAWLEVDKVKEDLRVVEADLKLLTTKIKKKNSELQPLQRKLEEQASTKSAMRNAISKIDTRLSSIVAEMDKFEDASEKLESDVNTEKQTVISTIERAKDHVKQVEEMKFLIDLQRNDLEKAKEELDADETIEASLAECDVGIEQFKSKNDKLMRERGVITKSLDENIIPSIRNCERKIALLSDTQRQRLEVLRNNYEDAFRAYEWLQDNRHEFRGRVFNPIMVEITVNEKENAKYIENTVGIKDLTAFVCTDKEDMKQLIKKFRNEMNLKVNVAYSDDTDRVMFQPDRDITDYPPSLGLFAYMIDMINGPAPIINYLCRLYNIHKVAVGDDRTFENASNIPQEFRLFFSTEHRFTVNISRYSKAKSSSSSIIQARNILNVGIDKRLKEREESNLAKWQRDAQEKKTARAKIETVIKQNEERLADVRNEKKEIQKRIQHVKLLADQLHRKEVEFETFKNRNIDIEAAKQIYKRILANSVQKLTDVNERRVDKMEEQENLRFERVVSRQKLKIFENTNGNVEEEIRKLQNEINTTQSLCNRVKERHNDSLHRMKVIEAKALELTDGFPPEHASFKYKDKFQELPNTTDELDTQIEEMQGRIDCIRGVDPKVVLEYEERKCEIEDLEKKLASEIDRMTSLETKIETLHEKWYPKVQEVIGSINENFSEYFKMMGFVGEVELIHKEVVSGWS